MKCRHKFHLGYACALEHCEPTLVAKGYASANDPLLQHASDVPRKTTTGYRSKHLRNPMCDLCHLPITGSVQTDLYALILQVLKAIHTPQTPGGLSWSLCIPPWIEEIVQVL